MSPFETVSVVVMIVTLSFVAFQAGKKEK